MPLVIIDSLLLYSKWDYSPWERLYVGLWTGLFFFVILSIYRAIKRKKDTKKEVEQAFAENEIHCKEVQRNIACKSLLSLSNEELDELRLAYEGLCDELKARCNPINFMEPYDAVKVEWSNYIYSKLDSSKDDITKLISLRNEAIERLGINIQCEPLYNLLCKVYNPALFTGDNYDKEKLSAANALYKRIQENKYKITELESIAEDVGLSFEDIIKYVSHGVEEDKNDERVTTAVQIKDTQSVHDDDAPKNNAIRTEVIVAFGLISIVIVTGLFISIFSSYSQGHNTNEVTTLSYERTTANSNLFSVEMPSFLQQYEMRWDAIAYNSKDTYVEVMMDDEPPKDYYKSHYFSELDNVVIETEYIYCVKENNTCKCFGSKYVDGKTFIVVVISDRLWINECDDILIHVMNSIRL